MCPKTQEYRKDRQKLQQTRESGVTNLIIEKWSICSLMNASGLDVRTCIVTGCGNTTLTEYL